MPLFIGNSSKKLSPMRVHARRMPQHTMSQRPFVGCHHSWRFGCLLAVVRGHLKPPHHRPTSTFTPQKEVTTAIVIITFLARPTDRPCSLPDGLPSCLHDRPTCLAACPTDRPTCPTACPTDRPTDRLAWLAGASTLGSEG